MEPIGVKDNLRKAPGMSENTKKGILKEDRSLDKLLFKVTGEILSGMES